MTVIDRIETTGIGGGPPDRDPSEWDREYLVDVAAAARADSWRLSGHRQLLEAVCVDYVQLEWQHRQDTDRIAELERKIARERESHRVTTVLQISGLKNELRLQEKCILLSEQLAVQSHARAGITCALHHHRSASHAHVVHANSDTAVFDVSDTASVGRRP